MTERSEAIQAEAQETLDLMRMQLIIQRLRAEAAIRAKQPATIGDVISIVGQATARLNARFDLIELRVAALYKAVGRLNSGTLRAISRPDQPTMDEVLNEVDFKRPTALPVSGQGG